MYYVGHKKLDYLLRAFDYLKLRIIRNVLKGLSLMMVITAGQIIRYGLSKIGLEWILSF